MLQCYLFTTTSITEQHCGNLTVCNCASYQFRCQNDILCTSNENLNNLTKWLYRIMTNESCLALSSIPQYINVICCHKNMCNSQELDDLTEALKRNMNGCTPRGYNLWRVSASMLYIVSHFNASNCTCASYLVQCPGNFSNICTTTDNQTQAKRWAYSFSDSNLKLSNHTIVYFGKYRKIISLAMPSIRKNDTLLALVTAYDTNAIHKIALTKKQVLIFVLCMVGICALALAICVPLILKKSQDDALPSAVEDEIDDDVLPTSSSTDLTAVVTSMTTNLSTSVAQKNQTFLNLMFSLDKLYSTKTYPISIANGDLNGDEVIDLVVANYYDNSIAVYFGSPDGRFNSKVVISVSVYPRYAIIADVNDDNYNDIIVAVGDDNRLVILRGFNNGNFDTVLYVPVGSSPCWIDKGYFNGDNFVDLVVANMDSSFVSILLGYGNGTFREQIPFPTLRSPTSAAVADFNRDGFLDITISFYRNSTISILFGHGDGSFISGVSYLAGGANLTVLTAGDFNNDGYMDIISCHQTLRMIQLLCNNGNGTFRLQAITVNITGAVQLISKDLNYDNYVDIIAVDRYGRSVHALLGYGNTIFREVKLFESYDVHAVAVADFNRDGQLDLASLSSVSDSLAIFFQNSTVT
ncbi:unnamed protein product [Adineta ricciae]|uniref:Uncharacterized protein n=1 Tax=Adineta ricciae TaxID=249248 RepID=A0A814JL59_ADIRI|nr:unnamed protein product [Adineta ricciae]